MVFNLVRSDVIEPNTALCKIPLLPGKHLLGRDVILDCDDKRISRNHAELEVTDDSVLIKALKKNPCFILRKNFSPKLRILKLNESMCLFHGDKIGFLPSSYWFELIDSNIPSIKEEKTNSLDNHLISQILDGDNHGANTEAPENERVAGDSTNNGADSPSQLSAENQDEIFNESIEIKEEKLSEDVSDNTKELGVSPLKRGRRDSLESSDVDNKRLKTKSNNEAEEINNKTNNVNDETTIAIKKENPVPDKSHDSEEIRRSPLHRDNDIVIKTETNDVNEPEIVNKDDDTAAGPSTAVDKKEDKTSDAAQGSPAISSSTSRRERCFYGENCHRVNPLHRAQFSHPSDADWGAEARPPCLWGERCRRRNPRHWAQYTHPNGSRAPINGKRKQRNVSDDEDSEESTNEDVIVTGKRVRKQIQRNNDWSGSESEDEDPFNTDDDDDEWQPPSEVFDSQNYSQV